MNHLLSKNSKKFSKDVSGYRISLFNSECGTIDCTGRCGGKCGNGCGTACSEVCGGCGQSCVSSCGERCGSGAKWN